MTSHTGEMGGLGAAGQASGKQKGPNIPIRSETLGPYGATTRKMTLLSSLLGQDSYGDSMRLRRLASFCFALGKHKGNIKGHKTLTPEKKESPFLAIRRLMESLGPRLHISLDASPSAWLDSAFTTRLMTLLCLARRFD